jgi:hypothetical protein
MDNSFIARAGGRHRLALPAFGLYLWLNVYWGVFGLGRTSKKIKRWQSSGSKAKKIAADVLESELP